PVKLTQLESDVQHDYHVPANWKLIIKNNNECLHYPTIHPELSRLLPYQSGANDLHEGEQLGGFMQITDGNESATLDGRACGVPIGDLRAEDRRRAFSYTLFSSLIATVT